MKKDFALINKNEILKILEKQLQKVEVIMFETTSFHAFMLIESKSGIYLIVFAIDVLTTTYTCWYKVE